MPPSSGTRDQSRKAPHDGLKTISKSPPKPIAKSQRSRVSREDEAAGADTSKAESGSGERWYDDKKAPK